MVKSEELMIGNLVMDKHGVILRVNAIYVDCISLKNGHNEPLCWIMPIVLTEEWLIKFGFEKIGQNFRNIEDHGYGLGMTEFVIWFNTYKKTYSIKAINILIEIETVHRLQNVYFALTSKELTHKKIN